MVVNLPIYSDEKTDMPFEAGRALVFTLITPHHTQLELGLPIALSHVLR
jgi:hypothetical protein